MSLKHSKFKNTYLIYEFLVRQVLTEYMSHTVKQLKDSKAFQIIKKNFSKGYLKEELNLFQAIVDNKIFNKSTAEYLVKECLDKHSRIPKKKLNKEKYALIGEIKQNYNVDKLFSTSVNEYKESASAYLLFEVNATNDIVTKAKLMENVIDSITTPKAKKEEVQISEILKNSSSAEKTIALKMLTNTFNKKYESVLNGEQKKFLSDYIYNPSLENGWFNEHVEKIDKKFNKQLEFVSKLKKSEYLNLQLTECKNKLTKLKNKKIVKEEDISKVMTFYKLIENLDDLKNKARV